MVEGCWRGLCSTGFGCTNVSKSSTVSSSLSSLSLEFALLSLRFAESNTSRVGDGGKALKEIPVCLLGLDSCSSDDGALPARFPRFCRL